jgi:hypothetical protein
MTQQPPDREVKTLTLEEVAVRLYVTPRRVCQLVALGCFSRVRRNAYNAEEVERYVQERARKFRDYHTRRLEKDRQQ